VSWYRQQRALKDYTGSNFDHRSEKSANREVANLLVRGDRGGWGGCRRGRWGGVEREERTIMDGS
jgi:hypothetical protein